MDDATSSARSVIEATIRDYIDGWYEGDVAKISRALHDDLAKRVRVTDDDGSIRVGSFTKERMVDLTEGGGGESPGASCDIVIHDISGAIATAQVLSLEYLDYLHLIETNEGWSIVNILFRARE